MKIPSQNTGAEFRICQSGSGLIQKPGNTVYIFPGVIGMEGKPYSASPLTAHHIPGYQEFV